MCIFSGAVEHVNNTKIFARLDESGERQAVVYSMDFGAAEELAMILPIPVAAGCPEDAVEFVDLSKYETLFEDLNKGFPQPRSARRSRAVASSNSAPRSALAVVSVGSFEASFVPTTKDFDRLDERFRLPADVWGKIGEYDDFGFAVFKLKEGNQSVHPMGFWFPTRHSNRVFWPTVHIHDGEIYEKAEFDHILYGQMGGRKSATHWEETREEAKKFVDIKKAEGLVAEGDKVIRRKIKGMQENRDQVMDFE
jgi:hypothetical protein